MTLWLNVYRSRFGEISAYGHDSADKAKSAVPLEPPIATAIPFLVKIPCKENPA